MPRVIESWEEFVSRQNYDYVKVPRGISFRTDQLVLRVVFANGAVSDGQQSHRDPPSDPAELLAMRHEYLRAKLQQEEEEFITHKTRWQNQAHWNEMNPFNCPPPPANAPQLLLAGAERITQLRRELAGVEQQMCDLKGPVIEAEADRARGQREAFQYQQTQAASLARAINAVNY